MLTFVSQNVIFFIFCGKNLMIFIAWYFFFFNYELIIYWHLETVPYISQFVIYITVVYNPTFQLKPSSGGCCSQCYLEITKYIFHFFLIFYTRIPQNHRTGWYGLAWAVLIWEQTWLKTSYSYIFVFLLCGVICKQKLSISSLYFSQNGYTC